MASLQQFEHALLERLSRSEDRAETPGHQRRLEVRVELEGIVSQYEDLLGKQIPDQIGHQHVGHSAIIETTRHKTLQHTRAGNNFARRPVSRPSSNNVTSCVAAPGGT